MSSRKVKSRTENADAFRRAFLVDVQSINFNDLIITPTATPCIRAENAHTDATDAILYIPACFNSRVYRHVITLFFSFFLLIASGTLITMIVS